MLEYQTKKLNEHITQIIDPTEVACFLVEGSERAILIDTGIGLKGLKETVERLTDKPYIVLLTHGHGDHAGGCSVFDTVYMNQSDRDLVGEHGMGMRIGYTQGAFAGMAAAGGPERTVSESDFVSEPAGDKEFLPLEDGQIFDLGGIHVEVIAVPGHTRGSVCMLFPEERAILFGDACNTNTLVGGEESTTISTYRESLMHLKTFEERYDTVYYSHGPVIGPTALDDNIELCEQILAGTDDHVPEQGFMGPGFLGAKRVGYERMDGKYGNIFYTERTAR